MLAVPDLFDVLDQLGDAVVILDRDYRIVAHNAAAERLGARPATDIAASPLWDTWTSPTGSPLKSICAGRCPNVSTCIPSTTSSTRPATMSGWMSTSSH